MNNNNVINIKSFIGTITETHGITSLDIIGNKLQNRMANCSTKHITLECICGEIKPVPIACQVRICPKCELIRRYKIDKRIFRYFQLFQHPKLLTLTFAEHQTPNKDTKEKCELYCREFRRSLADLPHDLRFKYHVFGVGYKINGFRFLECEPKSDGFHIHFHYIIDSKWFIPQKLISELWNRVTGTSFITYIQPISNKKGLEYALKYSSKPLESDKFKKLGFNKKQIMQMYLEFFYKTRMWTKLGTFYKMNLVMQKNILRCSKCGSSEIVIRFFYENPVTNEKYSAFDIKEDWGGKFGI